MTSLRAQICHWFSFRGSMGRADFNSVNILALLLFFAANLIFVSPLFSMTIQPPITVASIPLGWNAWVAAALVLVAAWMAISSAVRRLHDLGYSGWWLALLVAPLSDLRLVAGILGLIAMTFLRGKNAGNANKEHAAGPSGLS